MSAVFYIMASAVNVFLDALAVILLVRVISSFFTSEESGFFMFCYAVTEPVVSPVRNTLDRIPTLAESPIDFSYIATCLLIFVIKLFLPV